MSGLSTGWLIEAHLIELEAVWILYVVKAGIYKVAEVDEADFEFFQILVFRVLEKQDLIQGVFYSQVEKHLRDFFGFHFMQELQHSEVTKLLDSHDIGIGMIVFTRTSWSKTAYSVRYRSKKDLSSGLEPFLAINFRT